MRVRRVLAATEGARRSLEARAAELEARRRSLQEQARRARLADRQDLARLAFERCHAAGRELGALETQVEAVRMEEARLVSMEHQLAARIESISTRHALLTARYNAAQAQVYLNEALAGISAEVEDLRTVLESTEREAEDMETKAAALDRLVASGALELDAVFAGSTRDRDRDADPGKRQTDFAHP